MAAKKTAKKTAPKKAQEQPKSKPAFTFTIENIKALAKKIESEAAKE